MIVLVYTNDEIIYINNLNDEIIYINNFVERNYLWTELFIQQLE